MLPVLKRRRVERREEGLGPADIKGVGHGDDASHATLQKGGGDGGKGVFGFVVEGAGLAGVEDDGGDDIFVKRLLRSAADLGSASPSSFSKTRCTLSGTELIAARPCLKGELGTAISAMAVKMEEVVVPGVALEVSAKLIEGGWAEDVDVSGQVLVSDEVDERAGDGTVAYVVFVGTGDDEQNVDAIGGKVADWRRIEQAF